MTIAAIATLVAIRALAAKATQLQIVLSLSADLPFMESRSWFIDRLKNASTLHITDRDINLHAGDLADLTESLGGEVTIALKWMVGPRRSQQDRQFVWQLRRLRRSGFRFI